MMPKFYYTALHLIKRIVVLTFIYYEIFRVSDF